jgi:hypothetical protein
MLTEKARPRLQRPKPPGKKWRNVYWLARRIELKDSPSHAGGFYGPGRFVPRRVWPSREIAEQYGLRSAAKNPDSAYITYLGPEEV